MSDIQAILVHIVYDFLWLAEAAIVKKGIRYPVSGSFKVAPMINYIYPEYLFLFDLVSNTAPDNEILSKENIAIYIAKLINVLNNRIENLGNNYFSTLFDNYRALLKIILTSLQQQHSIIGTNELLKHIAEAICDIQK